MRNPFSRNSFHASFLPTIAPSTRQGTRPCTPPSKPDGKEHDTIAKSRFFDALDYTRQNESICAIAKKAGIYEGTGRR
jgi:hypothetical protein